MQNQFNLKFPVQTGKYKNRQVDWHDYIAHFIYLFISVHFVRNIAKNIIYTP